MSRGRVAMDLIKEVLRLHQVCGRSQREVARSCGVSLGTVNGLLKKAELAGLGWPLPEDLDEGQLHKRLYGRAEGIQRRSRREAIDFASVHKQLRKRKQLTLQLLWHEYREEDPGGYSYSQYCELYRQWKTRQDLVMLQEHEPGENLFVDYAGQTVPVHELETHAVRRRRCFWGCWERVRTSTPRRVGGRTWRRGLGAHVRTFEDMGGVPTTVVPDLVPGNNEALFRARNRLQSVSLPPRTAPIATGWSDSCRAGFAPAERQRLSTAHQDGRIQRRGATSQSGTTNLMYGGDCSITKSWMRIHSIRSNRANENKNELKAMDATVNE